MFTFFIAFSYYSNFAKLWFKLLLWNLFTFFIAFSYWSNWTLFTFFGFCSHFLGFVHTLLLIFRFCFPFLITLFRVFLHFVYNFRTCSTQRTWMWHRILMENAKRTIPRAEHTLPWFGIFTAMAAVWGCWIHKLFMIPFGSFVLHCKNF